MTNRIISLFTVAAMTLLAAMPARAIDSGARVEPAAVPTDIAAAIASTYAYGRRGHDYGGVSLISAFTVTNSESPEDTLAALVDSVLKTQTPLNALCGNASAECVAKAIAGGVAETIVPFVSDLIADFDGAPGAASFIQGLRQIRHFIVMEKGPAGTEYFLRVDSIRKVSFLVNAANTEALVVWYDLGVM